MEVISRVSGGSSDTKHSPLQVSIPTEAEETTRRKLQQLSLMKFLMCLLMCCSCLFLAASWIPQILIELCKTI